MPEPAAPQPPGPPLGPIAVVRFVGELAMLAGAGYVGWHLGVEPVSRILLAVGLPLGAAVAWGTFVGPRAPRRLADPARLGAETIIFGVTVAGLAAYDATVAAIGLAVLYLAGTMHGRAGG